jgi:hypothetical protein
LSSVTLTAALNHSTRQITGRGRVRWRNSGRVPAGTLRWHLYWNAWRDAHSSWMREAALAGVRMPATGGRDLIELTALRLQDAGNGSAVDLLPRLRFIAPDDGNEADRTLAEVRLDRPVEPGEAIEIELEWIARVPRAFDRTGVLGNYYFVAHWFPKIGVFGGSGWEAHQFHRSTEFFSDFADYDVTLTVPSGWVVGATGRETSRTINADGTSSHRYLARPVHDFAWTTSPDFIDARQEIQLSGQPPVSMRLLLQPEHSRQADRHWAAMRLALERFSQWFGPYPYDALTVVDPVAVVDPWAQGSETGGMEYPTLVTGWTNRTAPSRHEDPEDTVIHEIGHQFFQGVVATDEVDHAWMDEGITTYAANRLMAEAYAGRFVPVERYFGGLVAWPYDDVAWTRAVHADGAMPFRRNGAHDVPATPSWRYDPAVGRTATYYRTALWLHTLERMLGWDTMQRILSTYYRQFAFLHPAPDDFFRVANEVSGRDLTWFFDEVHRGAHTFDFAVGRVTPLPMPDGSFDHHVVVRRLGSGVLPVDLRVTFEDGSTATQSWDGQEPWRAFRFRRGVRVASVEVDPDYVLRLDVNRTNNSWTARPLRNAAAYKWSLRWLAWLQHQLLTYAFFA